MKIKNLTATALMTAVVTVISLISLPNAVTGVAITLQVFAVAFSGYLLGVKRGLLAVLSYIIIGLIGVPVFSGFRGGFDAIVGLTGGFIIGFLPLALFCGLSNYKNKIWYSILFGVIGLIVCHIFGVVQYSVYSKSGILSSAVLVSFPYLIKDLVLLLGAYFSAKVVKKALKRAKIEI